MKKSIVGVGIVILGAFLLVSRFVIKKDPEVVHCDDNFLIVGTSDDYPPYTFSQGGKVVGFDIDLVNEVAQRLGRFLILKTMSFDILLLELQRGTIQVIAAGVTPTAKRAQKVFFTSPYITADPLLAVTRVGESVVKNLADMNNKQVVVNEGYTADFYLSAQSGLLLEKRETVAECLLALDRYKVDVYVVAQSAYQPFLKIKGERFFTNRLADVTEKYALAVSKKFPLLFSKIELVIQELQEDGTIENLKRKWGLV